MSLLFESIQLRDGEFQRLELHKSRMNCSRAELLGVQPVFTEGDLVVGRQRGMSGRTGAPALDGMNGKLVRLKRLFLSLSFDNLRFLGL